MSKRRKPDKWQDPPTDPDEQRIRAAANLEGGELLVTTHRSGGSAPVTIWRLRFGWADVLHFWPATGKAKACGANAYVTGCTADEALALAIHFHEQASQASRHLARIARE